MISLSRLILYLGLAVLPFIFNPFEVHGFEGPKIFFFQRLVEVLILLKILDLVKNKTMLGVASSHFLVVIYFFWLILVSLTGLDPQTSLYGLFWRGQGLIMLAHYLGLVILLPAIISQTNIVFLGKLLAGVAFLVSLSLLGTLLGHHFFNMPTFFYLDRPVGTFGNPNFLAGFLAICVPFCFAFRSSRKWLMVVPIVGAIFLTGSRGALVALGLVVGILGLIRINQIMGWGKTIMLIGMLALTLFLLVKHGRISLWQRSGETCVHATGCENLAASRPRIYGRALLAIVKRPLTGYGLENYELAVQNIDYPFKIEPQYEASVDKAHNEILEILIGQGVIGLVLWSSLVGIAALGLYKAGENLWLIALVVFLLKAQTNVVSTMEYVLFWLIIGVGLATAHNRRSSPSGTGRK